jgi:A/G-specific adenine glycosylase
LIKSKVIVNSLLTWFATNARDLPWRRTRDPYAIWVSEIMLQQTQVKTVIPYWERWLRELPTIESLAHASAAKIHKLWEGLGYYTRVRNMHKAAQQIIDSCRRRGEEARSKNRQSAIGNRQSKSEPSDVGCYKFPDTFDAVLALPGIGRYTAGAICSIAFNQPTPILDGNVIRVLTRIHGIKTDPREKQTNAQLWELAEELVKAASEQENSAPNKSHEKFPPLPGERAGVRASVKTKTSNACSHLNQSLMELGALICTPRSPNCAACPVQKLCVAHKENLQDQLPNLGKREAATERRFLAFVVERDGKFLVRQRPEGIVNAHLWEFPNVEVPGTSSSHRKVPDSNSKQHAGKMPALPDGGFRPTSPKPLCTIKHSITRYRITLQAWRAELARNTPDRRSALQGEWRTLAQLHQLAFTSAHKKILRSLGAPIS